ncbi:MAG: hypothetical protein JXA09_14195 [Anaerolineae bacterium]|nr:hypothetical protein [Anaerolineae bacterium]
MRELGTFFWLQWRLTVAMFRTRRAEDQLQVVRLLSRVVVLLFVLPFFVGLGVGLGLAVAVLSPTAAYELLVIVNTFLFAVWLLLPASQNSQLVERFEMSRLFALPVQFRSLVVGSTLVSMLTMTGLWTVPLLVGEIVGLAWHKPLALPLFVLGALPLLALLVLTGRIMEDLFDLVAGDRRLRAVALALLSLPFAVCWLGQYAVQYIDQNAAWLPAVLRSPALQELARLGEPQSAAELIERVGRALEILTPSRLLVWTPPGLITSGMALFVRGEWVRGGVSLVASVGSVALLLWVHAQVTRRLMAGASLKVGAARVRRREMGARLPGPAPLWALIGKDWRYLWRSPMPRRLLLSALMMAVAVGLPLRDMSGSSLPAVVRRALPLVAYVLAASLSGMGTNMVMAANYFGTFDREGLAVLTHSPVDRRYVLLSANLSVLLYVMAQHVPLAVAIGVLTRSWEIVPLGLFTSLCTQLGVLPVCTLTAILAPYRTQLKFGRGHRRGNVWGMLAWGISTLPVLALVLAPYVLWQPGLVATLPVAALYSLCLYVVTLKPLSALLMRREYDVLHAVSEEA